MNIASPLSAAGSAATSRHQHTRPKSAHRTGTNAVINSRTWHRTSTNVGNKPSTNAGNQPSTNTGNQPSTNTGNQPSTNAGNQPSINAGNQPSTNADNQPNTNAGNQPSTNARNQHSTKADINNAGTNTAASSGTNSQCKVYVSGYPQHTKQHDLERVFSQFGQVRVESVGDSSATLSYGTKHEARLAVRASKQHVFFGKLLTVTKREQKNRTKKNDDIIPPKDLDLSGDFNDQVDSIMKSVRLTKQEVQALRCLYYDLENVLQEQWHGCKAIPFGSITTGLGIKSSDADCFISIPAEVKQRSPNHVPQAKRILMHYPLIFTDVFAIPNANTPIVKFFHAPTKTNCDVTFKTLLGVQNSSLLAFLFHADPRLIPLAVIIKYWIKAHGLSGTGKLTNYSLTMMIIFYLQQPPVSILPSVERLQKDAPPVMVDGWNTGFMADVECLPKRSNEASISELLGEFFQYYSLFDFDEMIVCPYLGHPVNKNAFKVFDSIPDQFHVYKQNLFNQKIMPIKVATSMCVQDPFEQSHNVASGVSGKLAAELKAYFKFAANAYEEQKLTGCKRLLPIILLQKPLIVRSKKQSEFRVKLFPRVVAGVVDPDWKAVVRRVVFKIFEDMLILKLAKEEKNPSEHSKKEKYRGLVTRAIWKRKQFVRLYGLMNMDLEARQKRITEEVLRVDRNPIEVHFRMMMKFWEQPRFATVSLFLASGDTDAFIEFGKFFISVVQNWFVELLKSQTRSHVATGPGQKPDSLDEATDAIRRVL